VGFDRDGFIESCVDALSDTAPIESIRELVLRAICEPTALDETFPVPVDPDDDGVLYQAPELFIASAMFPRSFRTGIHDHGVAAVIGLWAGHEDNYLFRRSPDGLQPSGVARVNAGETLLLSADAIHDVHSPATTWSAALHVYLGDIAALERHAWTDAASQPSRFDGAALEQRWADAAAASGLIRPD